MSALALANSGAMYWVRSRIICSAWRPCSLSMASVAVPGSKNSAPVPRYMFTNSAARSQPAPFEAASGVSTPLSRSFCAAARMSS